MRFAAGNIVVHKGGSPDLTLLNVLYGNLCQCAYWDGKQDHVAVYTPDQLEFASERNARYVAQVAALKR
jgi:hypothetical protein